MAGGMESMSQSPFTVSRDKDGKISMENPVDSMLNDGLIDPFNGMVMAQTGNRIAEQFDITREEADLFALESHVRAQNAHKKGAFTQYHIPVEYENGVLKTDEGIRPNSSLESLGSSDGKLSTAIIAILSLSNNVSLNTFFHIFELASALSLARTFALSLLFSISSIRCSLSIIISPQVFGPNFLLISNCIWNISFSTCFCSITSAAIS